mmetsp:Transcript_124074/g.345339  ORF Transcript_124074/g.345339 Transcript_124074/m.345339 type:complete len:243 (-) Transcript_124074:172-900(-)
MGWPAASHVLAVEKLPEQPYLGWPGKSPMGAAQPISLPPFMARRSYLPGRSSFFGLRATRGPLAAGPAGGAGAGTAGAGAGTAGAGVGREGNGLAGPASLRVRTAKTASSASTAAMHSQSRAASICWRPQRAAPSPASPSSGTAAPPRPPLGWRTAAASDSLPLLLPEPSAQQTPSSSPSSEALLTTRPPPCRTGFSATDAHGPASGKALSVSGRGPKDRGEPRGVKGGSTEPGAVPAAAVG